MKYKDLSIKCASTNNCNDCSCKKLCDKFQKKFAKAPCYYYDIAFEQYKFSPDEVELTKEILIDIVEGRA